MLYLACPRAMSSVLHVLRFIKFELTKEVNSKLACSVALPLRGLSQRFRLITPHSLLITNTLERVRPNLDKAVY